MECTATLYHASSELSGLDKSLHKVDSVQGAEKSDQSPTNVHCCIYRVDVKPVSKGNNLRMLITWAEFRIDLELAEPTGSNDDWQSVRSGPTLDREWKGSSTASGMAFSKITSRARELVRSDTEQQNPTEIPRLTVQPMANDARKPVTIVAVSVKSPSMPNLVKLANSPPVGVKAPHLPAWRRAVFEKYCQDEDKDDPPKHDSSQEIINELHRFCNSTEEALPLHLAVMISMHVKKSNDSRQQQPLAFQENIPSYDRSDGDPQAALEEPIRQLWTDPTLDSTLSQPIKGHIDVAIKDYNIVQAEMNAQLDSLRQVVADLDS
ncbi:hypothetical protein KCU95_g82, partial [Aureobasidium melanogenum]